MLTKDDFTKYKHQSFFLKLKELVANPNTNPFTFKMVFFGGTGAVGGQAVIEVLESYAYMKNASIEEPNARPQLVITGINKSQIEQFCGKLFQVFGKQQFKTVAEQGDESVLLYDGFVELHFKTLMAIPKFQTDLEEALKNIDNKQAKIDYLIAEASRTTSPFEAFIKEIKTATKPIENEIRAPTKIRLRRSRPYLSVPK